MPYVCLFYYKIQEVVTCFIDFNLLTEAEIIRTIHDNSELQTLFLIDKLDIRGTALAVSKQRLQNLLCHTPSSCGTFQQCVCVRTKLWSQGVEYLKLVVRFQARVQQLVRVGVQTPLRRKALLFAGQWVLYWLATESMDANANYK